MTKNERIAELEREVAELKKRPQVTYSFPVYPPYYRPTQYWPDWTYRPYTQPYCGNGTTTTVSSVTSGYAQVMMPLNEFLGVGGGM